MKKYELILKLFGSFILDSWAPYFTHIRLYFLYLFLPVSCSSVLLYTIKNILLMQVQCFQLSSPVGKMWGCLILRVYVFSWEMKVKIWKVATCGKTLFFFFSQPVYMAARSNTLLQIILANLNVQFLNKTWIRKKSLSLQMWFQFSPSDSQPHSTHSGGSYAKYIWGEKMWPTKFKIIAG